VKRKNDNESEIESDINSVLNSKMQFYRHSKNYKEHILRLYMKRLSKKARNKNELTTESITDLFQNSTIKLIEKALDVVKDILIRIPFPLNTMKKPYLTVYQLLSYTVTTERQLKDIHNITRLLFNFMLERRQYIQNCIVYCCVRLNKQPTFPIILNPYIKAKYHEKFKQYNDQDITILSDIYDYQWASLEFLLQQMDRRYCNFRLRNKHIFPQSKLI